jgi:hypothetical protein
MLFNLRSLFDTLLLHFIVMRLVLSCNVKYESEVKGRMNDEKHYLEEYRGSGSSVELFT